MAAREGRLLTLSSLSNYLKGHWKSAAIIFSRGVAAAISAVLCVTGCQFVLSEPGDKILEVTARVDRIPGGRLPRTAGFGKLVVDGRGPVGQQGFAPLGLERHHPREPHI